MRAGSGGRRHGWPPSAASLRVGPLRHSARDCRSPRRNRLRIAAARRQRERRIRAPPRNQQNGAAPSSVLVNAAALRRRHTSGSNSVRAAGLRSPPTRRRRKGSTAEPLAVVGARPSATIGSSCPADTRVPRQHVVELRERRPRCDENVSARPRAEIAIKSPAGTSHKRSSWEPAGPLSRNAGRTAVRTPPTRDSERCRPWAQHWNRRGTPSSVQNKLPWCLRHIEQ